MAGSRRVPEGPAPDPAVQRLRIRYAKRGRMRFTSTRDFQRALERAVRRAQLPVAFSAGFHPHPKISYANAAPTGTASEAEYVEVALTRQVEPASVAQLLDESLPDGLDVIDVADAGDLPGALADHLQGSVWALRFRATGRVADDETAGVAQAAPGHGRDLAAMESAVVPGLGPDLAGMESAVAALLAAREALVTRMMKKGPREIDVREAVLDLRVVGEPLPAVHAEEGDVVLLASVRHTTPTVRPEEIWTALRQVSGVDLPRPVSTRLRQGPVVDGRVADQLSG